MRRNSLIYFTFLGAALYLFALAASLTARLDGDFGGLELLRFAVLSLAVGCSLGTWATAVTIASIHKETWALYVTVAVILLGCLAFAIVCQRHVGFSNGSR